MKRKNSGITLIALIITIIIMLILAGVTISIVGGSDGLLAKAEKAVSETEKAAMQEDAELAIATIKMEYYEDYATNKNKTAKEFIVAKLAEPYETARGATLVADAEGNITYTLDEVATSLTIDENGKVTFGESSSGGTGSDGSGEGGSGETTPTIPEGLEVGDTVAYSPSGTYTWEEKYFASTVDYYEDVVLASGDKVTSSNQDMSISSWKVFSIDESTGQVELVPSVPTTNMVGLEGAQGYNNGVKLLNDACSSLYGNSSKGITARSINEDDIQNVMYYEDGEKIDFTEYYQINTAYSSPYNKYPTIYEQEDLSVIKYYGDTSETVVEAGTGLGRSEQTSFIERTTSGAVSGSTTTDGKIETATSIRPYMTYYDYENSEFTILLGEYASLVLPLETETHYWVASRFVKESGDRCAFGVRNIGGSDGSWPYQLYSYGTHSGNVKPLFPVVSLNKNLITGNSTDGWAVK